jgi:ligand-binding sensor domain-containing protein
VTKDKGLPGDEIQFLRQDDAGAVWIGTLSGLGVFRGGQFTNLVTRGEFWDVLQVGPHKHWVGGGGGALLIEAGKQTWSLPGNTVAPIIRVNDTTVWALAKNRGTERNTLMENAGGDWKPVARFEKERVVDVLPTREGAVWVALEGNGVLVVPPRGDPATAVQHLAGLNVTTMRQDSQGRVWCGLWGKGVAVWEKDAWTTHLTKEKSVILAIREDARGGIWVGTNEKGLWRYDGKAWTNDLADEGAINMLETTSDGRVWISSQAVGGLRYWDGTKWQVSLGNPLPIRCLLETKEKTFWAGGVLDGVYIRP